MVLNIHAFPSIHFLLDMCQQYHEDLVHEGVNALESGCLLPWPEKINKDKLWTVAGVKWDEKMFGHNVLPVLYRVVREAGRLIKNAGYSALLPGARIIPHEGYTDSVFRLHYGLVCPAGDCQIAIDGSHYKWHQKTGLLFDDTLTHEAWNNTDRTRIILLFDIKKDCL